ncbi:CAP1_2 [Blepharisma stoltei]|uniref:C-CAP/cofactor C-like domain-containing protein n=1 Tax=Blepharisma stoltei TaxID=1481888 RepID=A0AAU9K1S5_9CILI|nr:unnamed protein product [Blepharisma stoltei]
MAANLASLIERLEKAVGSLEGLVGFGAPAREERKAATEDVKAVEKKAPAEEIPPFLVEFQTAVLGKIPQLLQTAQAVDPQVVQISNEFIKGLNFVNDLLIASTKCRKPSDQENQEHIISKLQVIFKGLADLKNIRNNFTNHSTAAFEAVQSIQWPIAPMPGPIVDNFLDASAFYGNKVLMAKVETHTAWYKTMRETVVAMRDYVKANFAQGLNWNARGVSIGEHFAAKPTQAPKEETKAPVEEKKAAREETKTPAPAKKEPKKFERGISWIIENYSENKTLEISPEEAGLKKAIMIENCEKCIIQVKGKVKSIIISKCKNTSVVCQDIVSGIEIVNSTKTQMQSTGTVPSITIDNSDGAQLFLSKGLDDLIITTCKSSDMTITIPDPACPDEWIEKAIPHQFTHRISSGKVASAVSDVYNH